MSIIIFILFLIDKKSQSIKISFFLALSATIIVWLLTIINFFVEKKELNEYEENGYKFKPLYLYMYLDVKTLLDDQEKNKEEEKLCLEKYETLTNNYVKQKDVYLVYFENNPFALVRFHKNVKNKTCQIEYLSKRAINLEKEIAIILKKENLTKID